MSAKARREPQRVGSILEKTLKKMSLDGKLRQHEAMNVWNCVVGEHVSRHAQPEFIRNKILFVRVSSPQMGGNRSSRETNPARSAAFPSDPSVRQGHYEED
jgi:predicted nucleic acid-binding Zn ribbon protein